MSRRSKIAALMPTLRLGGSRIISVGKRSLQNSQPRHLPRRPRVKMAYKLQTDIGRAIYRLRKMTVEPVIGLIKEVLGFRQFSLRGLGAAAGQWCLVCLAFNLKRLHVLMAG
jgi:hypothetical protein